MNLPNKITIFRMFLIPVMMVVYAIDGWNTPMFEGNDALTVSNFIILLIIFIGAISDFLDGMIARKYNLVTNFGKFLDPIADKLLVITGFVILLDQFAKNGRDFIFSWWMLAIIIAREFIVSGVRLIAVENNRVIAASKWGKIKTVIQLVTLIYLFLGAGKTGSTTNAYDIIALIFVYGTMVATVFSGWDYVYKNRDVLYAQVNNKKQPKQEYNSNNNEKNNQSKKKKKKK